MFISFIKINITILILFITIIFQINKTIFIPLNTFSFNEETYVPFNIIQKTSKRY